MLLMGTSAAAVPAAATSVKVPISSYLICELKILFSFFFFFFFFFVIGEEERGEERSFQLLCLQVFAQPSNPSSWQFRRSCCS